MRKNSLAATTIITLLTVATTLVSCNRKTVFYHYEHTPIAGWEKNDTLTFNLKAAPETGLYKEAIGLRTNGAYPFMALTLIVDHTVVPARLAPHKSSPITTHSDTINCRLTNDEGNVKGAGISNRQYMFDLGNIRLNKGDSLHIRIRHDMKRETLPGIIDVGVKLTSLSHHVAAGVNPQKDEQQ